MHLWYGSIQMEMFLRDEDTFNGSKVINNVCILGEYEIRVKMYNCG